MEFSQNNLIHYIALFIAGGCGVCFRAILIKGLDPHLSTQLPGSGLLFVNLLGCFSIGLFATLVAKEPWRSVLIIGLLGGFTTYSSFALLLTELWASMRWLVLMSQLSIHILGGILCAILGQWMGKILNSTF